MSALTSYGSCRELVTSERAILDGFFEAWPRGQGFRKFIRLHVDFGDPIDPPQPVDNPERTYELMTAELKARVMDMWLEMRDGGQRQAAD